MRTFRRAAGVAALVPLGFVLLLVVLAVTAAAAAALYAATETDDARLESLRWTVAWAVVKVFGARARPGVARAYMAILANELPRDYAPGDVVVGDQGASFGGGPSIGPGQVYRATAKELGLWAPAEGMTDAEERDAYAQLAATMSTGELVEWGVRVFRAKLLAAQEAHPGAPDDEAIADAVRRYNGSGPRALAYQERAINNAGAWWGGFTG